MEDALIGAETSGSGIVRYPPDFDIVTYDDGRWRYAASLPDDHDFGSFREVYLSRLEGGNWELRLYENVGSTEIHGVTSPRWERGLSIDTDGARLMTYETARDAAEVWLRGGSIFGIA